MKKTIKEVAKEIKKEVKDAKTLVAKKKVLIAKTNEYIMSKCPSCGKITKVKK